MAKKNDLLFQNFYPKQIIWKKKISNPAFLMVDEPLRQCHMSIVTIQVL